MQKMKQKKLLFLTMVLWILAALAFTNVEVQAQVDEVRIFVMMPPPLGYIAGVAPDGLVQADVWIDCPASWYDTNLGIVQWALSVAVDPTVLEPMGVMGAKSGYFLYDYVANTLDPWGFVYSTVLLSPTIDKAAGTMVKATEGINPDPPTGAGGLKKLCTLGFKSLSETGYSPIDLYFEVGADAYYWTTGGVSHVVDYVDDGHYNLPPDAVVFETPTGGTYPTGNPIGTDWHELEPNYCNDWTLESWDDNGDGILSPSDQIDMYQIDPPLPDLFWFHVEWVNPMPTAGDGVADMWATLKPDVPEFPLGSVAPIALIAAVAYIWWVTRRKRHEVT